MYEVYYTPGLGRLIPVIINTTAEISLHFLITTSEQFNKNSHWCNQGYIRVALGTKEVLPSYKHILPSFDEFCSFWHNVREIRHCAVV